MTCKSLFFYKVSKYLFSQYGRKATLIHLIKRKFSFFYYHQQWDKVSRRSQCHALRRAQLYFFDISAKKMHLI